MRERTKGFFKQAGLPMKTTMKVMISSTCTPSRDLGECCPTYSISSHKSSTKYSCRHIQHQLTQVIRKILLRTQGSGQPGYSTGLLSKLTPKGVVFSFFSDTVLAHHQAFEQSKDSQSFYTTRQQNPVHSLVILSFHITTQWAASVPQPISSGLRHTGSPHGLTE